LYFIKRLRVASMPFGILFATMLGAADVGYKSPSGQAAAADYVAAIKCASDFADRSTFERDRIDAIAREAIEHCAAAREAAVKSMIKVMPDADEKLALDNISAKMRMEADDRLIARLERGDYPMSMAGGDPMEAVTAPAARLVFCMRVAMNRKLEGLYLGDNWLLDLRGQSEMQRSIAFAQLGQASCPVSQAAYLVAFNETVQMSDRDTRDALNDGLSLAAIQAIATEPYIGIVPD
jgi:hypothetical protein